MSRLIVHHRGRCLADVEVALLPEHDDEVCIETTVDTQRYEVVARRLVIASKGSAQTATRVEVDVEPLA